MRLSSLEEAKMLDDLVRMINDQKEITKVELKEKGCPIFLRHKLYRFCRQESPIIDITPNEMGGEWEIASKFSKTDLTEPFIKSGGFENMYLIEEKRKQGVVATLKLNNLKRIVVIITICTLIIQGVFSIIENYKKIQQGADYILPTMHRDLCPKCDTLQ